MTISSETFRDTTQSCYWTRLEIHMKSNKLQTSHKYMSFCYQQKSHIFVWIVADIYHASNVINNAMLPCISVHGSLGTYMGLLTGNYRIEVRNTNSNTNSNMQTPWTFEVTCNYPNLKQELHVRDFGQTNIYGLNANGYDDEVLHKFSM
jgi:hypothetical protein